MSYFTNDDPIFTGAFNHETDGGYGTNYGGIDLPFCHAEIVEFAWREMKRNSFETRSYIATPKLTDNDEFPLVRREIAFYSFEIHRADLHGRIVEQVGGMLIITAAHSIAEQLDRLIKREQYLVASFRHEAPEERVAAISPVDREMLIRFYRRVHSCRWVLVRREQSYFPELLIL